MPGVLASPIRSPLPWVVVSAPSTPTPATILGAKLVEWWTADAGITVTGAGVSSWVGQVGGLDMVQGTDGVRPGYSATAWNSAQPGVTSDGTKYLRSASLPAGFPVNTDYSELWAVFDDQASESDADGTRDLIGYGGTSNGTYRALRRASVSNVSRIRASDGGSSSAVDSSASAFGRHYARAVFSTTPDLTASLDGAAFPTAASYSSTGTTRVALFNSPGVTATGFVGVLRDVLVLNAAPSAGELTALRAWMAARAV